MTIYPDWFAAIEARVGASPVDEPLAGSGAAPWVGQTESISEAAEISLAPAKPEESRRPAWPSDLVTERFIDMYANRSSNPMSADTVAAYKPWHLYRERWGIVINELPLLGLTALLARRAGVAPLSVAPFALRQVIAHELVHFAFEVAGSEIEDLLGEPRYASYVTKRYGAPNRWSIGPLEEVIATWNEIVFSRARAPAGLGRKPSGYVAAVAASNTHAPAGYRDFWLMQDERRGERIVADVASLIADREVWNSRWWPHVSPAEAAEVPLWYQGDLDLLGLFGALPKAVAAPTIRRFQRWLSQIGATPLRGTRHAKVLLPNGRRASYTATKGVLLPPEADRIARLLGLSGKRDLFEHVATGRVPALLIPAEEARS